MASEILYPPIVDSNSPAFVAGGGCRLYFSLSKFNSGEDFQSVQATVIRQNSGMSVVNDKTNGATHYRNTGVILNIHAFEESKNLYYIDIPDDDILGGWTPGWIYKIQIRLSKDNYIPGSLGQSAWLTANASSFSEWSTICITKAIGQPSISISGFTADSLSNIIEMNFYGSYECPSDHSETLYSYRVSTELEDSGIIRANPQSSETDIRQYFSYVFKKDYEYEKQYTINFTYETKNKYTNTIKFPFILEEPISEKIDIKAITYEENPEFMKAFTSIGAEEEEGRIGIKLYSENNINYTGSICIKRSDNNTNFSEWQDIKIINFKNQSVNEYPIVYDYTAESGTIYRYAVQSINTSGVRGLINKTESSALRDYNYSFLVGENGQQLKLMFDNTMNNFKINIAESKTDTVGGKYARFSRNGDMYYKGFPINGLISFNMDEAELFTNKSKAYGSEELVERFEQYNIDNSITRQFDRIYERKFRDLVLKFLYDGKPKLFKSPTEGNVIIRLMDINCTPNQTTNRLIYSFTANAYEIASATLDQYLEFGFLEIGEFNAEILSAEEKRTGRITLDIPVNQNILNYIVNAFGSNGEPTFGGYIETVTSISDLKITINDIPLKIKIDNETIVGNILEYNGNKILLYNGYYNFGEGMSFTNINDSISLQGDVDNTISTINVTIDCDYNILQEIYKESESEKQYSSKTYLIGYGQIFTALSKDTDIYQLISNKYTHNARSLSIDLSNISELEFEAPKYSVFEIDGQNHMVGETELLHLSNDSIKSISFKGCYENGEIIDKEINALITFKYMIVKKVYEEG